MKHKRMALLLSVLLVLTLAFAGCGKDSGASGGGQAASAAKVMGSVRSIYLEKNDGGESANTDVTDKETIKVVRTVLNGLREAKDVAVPEDEEPYVYLEWDGGETSKYAFVYHMTDGSSLVEVSESNSDNAPEYFTGDTVYNDLAAIIDKAAVQ